jgi:ubiquinone biosynthesis protein
VSALWPIPWFARPQLHRRLRQIAAVLTRHGFGWLLAQVGLHHYPGERRSRLKRLLKGTEYSQAQHLRMALGELGGAFIKLGQVLSTRADLVPAEYLSELASLQDAAPPVPYADIQAVIAAELGASPGQIFAFFDPEPAASASIGQAHAARLHDGTELIVKVQRPGIEHQANIDLEILRGMCEWAQANTALGEYYDLAGLADEFAYTLRNEMDYRKEGRNADRFRALFNGDTAIYIPKVFWKYSTDRVLTMERVSGIKVSDIEALQTAGINRGEVARNSVRLMLREVFEFGFFHADPHPGNFFVQPDASIALIDFGMVGRLDQRLQATLLRVGMAAVRRDAELLADEFYMLGVVRHGTNRASLQRDLDHLLSEYASGSVRDLAAAEATSEMMAVSLRHRLQLPSALVMLFRVIGVSEALGAKLDPDFRLMDFASPYIKQFWQERRSPSAVTRQAISAMSEAAELTLELPRRASRLLSELERGDIEIRTHIGELKGLQDQLQATINRLAVALVLSATIIVIGMALLIHPPPGWDQMAPWLLGLAWLASAGCGIWLVWRIWRSGKW